MAIDVELHGPLVCNKAVNGPCHFVPAVLFVYLSQSHATQVGWLGTGILAITAATAVYAAAESSHWLARMPRDEIRALTGNFCRAVILARAAIQSAIKAVIAAMENGNQRRDKEFVQPCYAVKTHHQNAVSAVMESLRHVVVQDVGKFPRRSGSPKKGCKKTRSKLIIRLSRVRISRRDSSKIFSHMIV